MNNILFQALSWHFYDAPKEILKAWKSFLYFSSNYFSVPVLLRTFLSPWRKYGDSYGSPVEVWKNLEVFVFNTMSRIIGALLRTIFIILGAFFIIFAFIVGLVVFVVWIVLPLILIFGFLVGINLLL